MNFTITIQSITVKPLTRASEDVLMVEGLYEGVSVTFPMSISALPFLRIGKVVQINLSPVSSQNSISEESEVSEVFESEASDSQADSEDLDSEFEKIITSDSFEETPHQEQSEVIEEEIEQPEKENEQSSEEAIEKIDKTEVPNEPYQVINRILGDFHEILLKEEPTGSEGLLEVKLNENSVTYENENIPKLEDEDFKGLFESGEQENE